MLPAIRQRQANFNAVGNGKYSTAALEVSQQEQEQDTKNDSVRPGSSDNKSEL